MSRDLTQGEKRFIEYVEDSIPEVSPNIGRWKWSRNNEILAKRGIWSQRRKA